MQLRRGADKVAQEGIERKVKSRICPTIIRVVASAPNAVRANELVDNLIAPFSQYDDPKGNHLVFHKVGWWSQTQFLRQFTYRSFDDAYVMPLSLAEITTLFHFTAERVTTSRELKKSYAKQTPAPVEMAKEGIIMGINQYGADRTNVDGQHLPLNCR